MGTSPLTLLPFGIGLERDIDDLEIFKTEAVTFSHFITPQQLHLLFLQAASFENSDGASH